MFKLNLRELCTIISPEKRSKSLVIPTGKTTDHMAFKFFSDTMLLLKVVIFEGILNWIKIDGMVNDHLSRCNS